MDDGVDYGVAGELDDDDGLHGCLGCLCLLVCLVDVVVREVVEVLMIYGRRRVSRWVTVGRTRVKYVRRLLGIE